MFKKFIFISLFFTLTTPYLRAQESAVFTDRWGEEKVSNDGEKLYNYVQNGCSHLLGNKFSKIESQKRKNLYDTIQSDIHYSCGGGINASSFNKDCVDQKIITHTINLIAEKTKERYQNSTSDWSASNVIYGRMKEHLLLEAQRNHSYNESYGSPKGFFEKSLDDQVMVNDINAIKNDLYQQTPTASYSENQSQQSSAWGEFVNWLFGTQDPFESTHYTPDPYYDRPPATNPNWHPEPSAPPAQQPAQSAPHNKKLYPAQECSADCMGDFKDDGLERIFLPCGHDACKDCARNWFVNQGKSTCPQCRYSLNNTEKQNLKNSLDQPFRQCSCCNTTRNLQTLHCNHKICTECTSSWITNENTKNFKAGCPRCGNHFIYR